MKKTTSNKLSKQLTKYGALAAAIVGVTDVNGQTIVYNDITDFTGGVGDTFLIDINNDGTNDFELALTNDISTSSYGFNSINRLLIRPLAANNNVLGYLDTSNGGYNAFPYALSNGDVISSGATGDWNNNGFTSANRNQLGNRTDGSYTYGSTTYTYGPYCGGGSFCNSNSVNSAVNDKFLGLRFDISGNIHYAWALLDVDMIGESFVVKSYGYDIRPGAALNAGDQPLSVTDNALDAIKVVALNKTIGLYNLPETTNYRLLNITGQQVLDGNTTGSTFTVEANTLANGIYIIELTDTETNAVMRQKIVL